MWRFEYERGLSRAETEAFLDRQKRLWSVYRFGGCAVRDREQDMLLGVVGLGVPTFPHPSLPSVTIGWRFASKAWGRGYATEAATALLDQAFDAMQLDAVGCVTHADNRRSVAVAQRVRMKIVGNDSVLRDDRLGTVPVVILRVDAPAWFSDEPAGR